jgi:glucokinase
MQSTSPTPTLLAGDIGGTKTLLSLYVVGAERPELLVQERFPSAEWSDLAPMLDHFLATVVAGHHPSPQATCLAVAGPVQGGRARLTNLPWQLDERVLAQGGKLGRVELVNDFAVLIYGLPLLAPEQLATVSSGEAQPGEPLLVLGAGTGLGVALGVPTANGLQAIASEGAHGEFAARNAEEWDLREWLRQDLGLERLSIERVVSGTGLGHVGRWLLARRDPDARHPLAPLAERWRRGDDPSADLPAALAAAAASDELARDALDLWLGAYGSVVGDLALAGLSRGGIWLAGGTAAKLLGELRSARFREAFLAKGRLQPALGPIPIQAITDPAVGSFSAACRARMLLG